MNAVVVVNTRTSITAFLLEAAYHSTYLLFPFRKYWNVLPSNPRERST